MCSSVSFFSPSRRMFLRPGDLANSYEGRPSSSDIPLSRCAARSPPRPPPARSQPNDPHDLEPYRPLFVQAPKTDPAYTSSSASFSFFWDAETRNSPIPLKTYPYTFADYFWDVHSTSLETISIVFYDSQPFRPLQRCSSLRDCTLNDHLHIDI